MRSRLRQAAALFAAAYCCIAIVPPWLSLQSQPRDKTACPLVRRPCLERSLLDLDSDAGSGRQDRLQHGVSRADRAGPAVGRCAGRLTNAIGPKRTFEPSGPCPGRSPQAVVHGLPAKRTFVAQKHLRLDKFRSMSLLSSSVCGLISDSSHLAR